MCGFTGFVGQTDNREQVLENMMNTIIHRGPDSFGSFIDEDAALGFRRLSIIDIGESGDQPLYNEDKTMVLTFNGEIYNYPELREELINAGHTFVTHTDSETLIHGYEEWGEKLVERLRGMYAFVIWDRKEKKLFGARDMFGIKPFYYAEMNGCFFFGSEIKSFLPHPRFEKKFNEEALGLYLSFQFVPINETFFKGVYCLQPGHYFSFQNGELTIKRYFEPHFVGNNDKPFEKVVDEVEAVMKESVEAHKIKYEGTLQDLYEKDYEWYYFYNAIDSLITALIHYRLKSIESPCAVSSVTLVPLSAATGQIALTTANVFEEFYKDNKKVVYDWDEIERVKIPYEGAFCDAVPGRFGLTVCDDFASLYPSQIRTCNFSFENFMQKKVPNNIEGLPDVIVPWDPEELEKFRISKCTGV